MSASRRIATYRRAARSDTPSLSPSWSAVMPGLFWISSRTISVRAVGLTSYAMPLTIAEVHRPEQTLPLTAHPVSAFACDHQGMRADRLVAVVLVLQARGR